MRFNDIWELCNRCDSWLNALQGGKMQQPNTHQAYQICQATQAPGHKRTHRAAAAAVAANRGAGRCVLSHPISMHVCVGLCAAGLSASWEL